MNAIRAVLVAGVLGLAGCSSATPAPATPAPTVAPSVVFGGTDLAWIEINIAMDEQLLPLLELVPARSADPQVKALIAQVKAFTDAELATLRRLHGQAALPSANPHEGMPMPGMVAPSTVTAATALRGAAFDKLVVTQIKGHLVQSRSLAESENKAGVEPQTRALATEVLRTRKQALSIVDKASRGRTEKGAVTRTAPEPIVRAVGSSR